MPGSDGPMCYPEPDRDHAFGTDILVVKARLECLEDGGIGRL